MNHRTEGKPGHRHNTAEAVARALLFICAVAAIFAVCAITFYMFAKGLPALGKIGVKNLLFGTVWKPTASEPRFGIAYIILSSLVGTALSVALGVPLGLFTAVFLTEVSGKKMAALVEPAVELLAAIPAALPVKNWLRDRLAARREQGSHTAAAALALGPKVLACGLLGWSCVRLLSSTFRSFLYFQF